MVAGATGQDEAAIALDRRSSSALKGEPGAAAAAAAGRAWPAGLVPEVPLCSCVAAAAAAATLPARVRIILHDVQDALDQVRARGRRAPRACAGIQRARGDSIVS